MGGRVPVQLPKPRPLFRPAPIQEGVLWKEIHIRPASKGMAKGVTAVRFTDVRWPPGWGIFLGTTGGSVTSLLRLPLQAPAGFSGS